MERGIDRVALLVGARLQLKTHSRSFRTVPRGRACLVPRLRRAIWLSVAGNLGKACLCGVYGFCGGLDSAHFLM